ncbi:MAG: hypothetical protein AAF403_03605 [Pseudomonadota bacterium]
MNSSPPDTSFYHKPLSKNYFQCIKKALIYIDEKSFEKAIEAIDQANQIERERPETYHVSGLMAFRLGRYKNALDAFEKAHKINFYFFESVYMSGMIKLMSGLYREGLFDYKLLETLPRHPQLMDLLLPLWVGSIDKALEYGDDLILFSNRHYLLRTNQLFEALKLLEELYQINPSEPQILREYAKLLMVFNRPLEACEIFEKACFLSHHEPQDFNGYLNALMSIGAYEEVYQKALTALTNGHKQQVQTHIMFNFLAESAKHHLDVSDDAYQAILQNWNESIKRQPRNDHDFCHNVKIGILSAYVYEGGGLDCLWPLISDLSVRFEIVIYAFCDIDDFIAKSLRARCQWVNCTHIDDQTLKTIIEQDQCDILIDMDHIRSQGRPHLALASNAPLILAMLADEKTALALNYDGVVSFDLPNNKKLASKSFICDSKGLFYLDKKPVLGRFDGKQHKKILFLTSYRGFLPKQLDLWKDILDVSVDTKLAFTCRLMAGQQGWSQFFDRLKENFDAVRFHLFDSISPGHGDIEKAIDEGIDFAVLEPGYSHLDEVYRLLSNHIPVVGLESTSQEMSVLNDRLLMRQIGLEKYLFKDDAALKTCMIKMITDQQFFKDVKSEITKRCNLASGDDHTQQRFDECVKKLYQLANDNLQHTPTKQA